MEDGAANERPVWTRRYKRPVDGGYGRACALGVRREGELLGVLALGFGMEFIADYLRKELDSPVFEAPQLMREMVAEGKLGKKSGQGFYEW